MTEATTSPAPAAGGPHLVARPRLVLAATILASSLAFVDGSIVNVALPAIGRDLGAGGAGLSWVVNGYLLPLGALLLVGGALGDRCGRGRLLQAGIGVFALASALCALAPGLGSLVAGRLLQGVGAALLMPNSLAVLGASFAGEARGRAVGTWAAVGAAAAAGGPLLGGWLVDAAGWRSAFLVNLPLAAAAAALAAAAVRDAPAGDRPPLDLLGAALACAALAGLTFGLTEASGGGGGSGAGPAALGAAALGVAAGGAFLAVERRRGAAAMMPLALFASRPFVGLTLMTLLLYAAVGGLSVLLPTALIAGRGLSATAAGAALLPLPLGLALLSPAAGRLAGRIGPRLPLSLGPAVVALGFLLLSGAADRGGAILPGMAVLALGMASAVAPLTAAVLAASDPAHVGTASGFNSAVARTGGLVATALLGGVLAARGPDLAPLVRGAALAGAGLSAAAGAAAFLLVRGLDGR